MGSNTVATERPILMDAESIGAILAGRKIQTRRLVKPPPPDGYEWDEESHLFVTAGCALGLMRHCPYGAPGDRLWVRETWAAGRCAEGLKPSELAPAFWKASNGGLWYRADGQTPSTPVTDRGRWRPSIHMPRWASRITLEVTDVRVERLQDISEADAVAEGVQAMPSAPASLTDRTAFGRRWEGIHGPGSWDRNDWVWAVSFRRVEP